MMMERYPDFQLSRDGWVGCWWKVAVRHALHFAVDAQSLYIMSTISTCFLRNEHACYSALNPSGLKIFSLAVLAATSPPLCNANAPTILYSVWAITTSIPDASKLSLRRGFQRITLSIPYCLATRATRDFSRICAFVKAEMFSAPCRLGCWYTCAEGRGWGKEGSESRAREVCRSRIRLPRKARRSLKPRRPWSKDLWVMASHCYKNISFLLPFFLKIM